jgi:hypothetical protein
LSKIDFIIPSRNFELIRDRVAEILTDEIANQYVLSQDDDINASVWGERTNPFDKTECPAINICLSNATYLNKHQGSFDGTYIFNIDVFSNSKAKADQPGDKSAALKCQRLLGLCQSILENPIYKTLGFSPGFISRVFTNDLNLAVPEKDDALNTMWGRLTFHVVANETSTLLTRGLIAGYETSVKIENTNNGHQYKSA